MEPYPGAELGAYLIERKVGEGAFGAVWCGIHQETGERVALKVLLAAAAANQEQVSRFHREAELLARVRSANVARMVDVLVSPQFGVVLIMEFIDGELMSDLLGAGLLKVEETIEIGAQILDGVCDLHAVGIIHRDLKPNNIMLCTRPDGMRRVVIFDLGLSRLIRGAEGGESTRSLTGSHVALGTIECMAPEQILNARDVTERSDVYSVGSILYRAMTGYYPFAEEDERDLARRKLTVETPAIVIAPLDPIAEGLRAIITKATRRRPAQRYEKADLMREDFRALQELVKSRVSATGPMKAMTKPEGALALAPPPSSQVPTVIIDGRQKKSSGLVMAVMVVCAVIGVALVWRTMQP